MAEHIKSLETSSLAVRAALAGVVAAGLLFGWFSVRWQIGNMFAALTPVNAPNAKEIADLAGSMSPSDPMTNWFRASVEREEFSNEALNRSVAHLETMVRNAPYDFRYWVELGRGLEQAEQFDRAEAAFRRALELAPNYSYAHWQAGNFYLRRGREDEAMASFRRAAETSSSFREQVFSIAWDYFERDMTRLESLAGSNAEVRAGLAKFYAAREEAAASLRIWNTLSAEEKQSHQDVARVITQALYEKRFYRSAVQFVRQLAIEPQAELGEVQNGGFESPIPEDAQKSYFNWRITRLEKAEARPDQLKKRDGNRSLRLSFTGFAGREIKNVWQVVAVEGGKRYRLGYWVRTENLKSAGTPLVEVVNANDDKIIATGPAFPTETSEWQLVKVEFEAPPNAEGVLIRIDRAYCGEACPIVGSAWIDDVKLEKL